jgi:hypothetical protein
VNVTYTEDSLPVADASATPTTGFAPLDVDFTGGVTGGDAQILAGGFMSNPTDYGLIVSCIEGRVIIQTFSDHDYHREDIQALWENYITYVLTNHFAALP